jgi:acyl dehydratase
MTQELHLEDLCVGQIFCSGPRVISQEEMIRFARDNDPQYFHVDPEAAKNGMFRGLIASGWQTAALSMRLFVEEAAPFAKGVVGVEGDFHWPAPVRPGDAIRVEAEVLAIEPRSRADRGFVLFRTKTFNQKDELVLLLTARLLVFARGAGA